MSLNFSAAHSSRIKKKSGNKNPLLKRTSSSPFSSSSPRKAGQRSQAKQLKIADDDEDLFEDYLDDRGLVTSLATDLSLQDVPQYVRYIHSHMFDPVPEKGGMNSTRIAEVLNFRKSLPPSVTVAHVHALADSPTFIERQIAEMAKAGIIRKTVVPGRGTGGSNVSDSLVLSQDLEKLLNESSGLDQHLIDKFWHHLQENPTALKIPRTLFSNPETTALMRAGFLTSTSPSLNSANIFLQPNPTTSGTTTTSILSISRAASGSIAAVGGDGAIHGAGNTGKDSLIRLPGPNNPSSTPPPFPNDTQEFHLALPNTGLYLKLLTAARSHLLSLLLKSKHRHLPLALLRERWDGGIAGNDPAAAAKRYRGEFKGVLPGRTRKWKQFYGLRFEWVLAECVGSGLVEGFETGSVGRGVRAV